MSKDKNIQKIRELAENMRNGYKAFTSQGVEQAFGEYAQYAATPTGGKIGLCAMCMAYGHKNGVDAAKVRSVFDRAGEPDALYDRLVESLDIRMVLSISEEGYSTYTGGLGEWVIQRPSDAQRLSAPEIADKLDELANALETYAGEYGSFHSVMIL